jgi:hypothetical protein
MHIFYSTSESALALAMLIAFFAATHVGFWLGCRHRAGADEATKTYVNTLQGSLLGLLALLLGFTFAIAVSRFDLRKELVLREAIAIETTYLRARLLAEPHRGELVGLLRAYVDARLAFYDARSDRARLAAANASTERLQEQLWMVAIAMAEHHSESVPLGLVVPALNDVIELSAERLRALENRIPETVIYLVCLVAVVALSFIGYGCGLRGRRHLVSTALVALLLALVLAVILDLDRPRQGLLKVGQESMVSLKETLKPTTP